MSRRSTRQRQHRRERRKATGNPLRPGKRKMGAFYGHGAGIGNLTIKRGDGRKGEAVVRRKRSAQAARQTGASPWQTIGDMTDNVLLEWAREHDLEIDRIPT